LAQQQQSQASPAPQSGDPVADAARKAREQQKAAPKPKKVYTDDDVKPATPASDAAATPASGAAQAADNGTAANGAEKPDDPEKVWRKRFQDQRDKIAAAEKELDILQREADKAQVQYYNDPQKAMQEQYSRKDINDKNAKIDQKKQQIADLKQQLSDMEDELRKSGGDPGWAR
jgi:DNA repair exonuclease SbcCD ATPase subunit